MRLRDTTTTPIADHPWAPFGQVQSAWHEGIPITMSGFMICAVCLLSALVSCAAESSLL